MAPGLGASVLGWNVSGTDVKSWTWEQSPAQGQVGNVCPTLLIPEAVPVHRTLGQESQAKKPSSHSMQGAIG